MPAPALALLRRTALADRLALGLLKAGLSEMVYGTDVDDSHEKTGGKKSATTELEKLRARVAELETEIKGGKA